MISVVWVKRSRTRWSLSFGSEEGRASEAAQQSALTHTLQRQRDRWQRQAGAELAELAERPLGTLKE